jgi:Zn-dependent protease with chaperone function
MTIAIGVAASASAQSLAQTPDESARLIFGGRSVRELVPAEEIDQRAQREYAQIIEEARAQHTLAEDGSAQLRRVRDIARRLLPETTRWNERARDWNWQVNLIESRQVNAFCMPGGKVAVYSGLLDQLRLTDDELAMVLGHEMAHALQEHARERAAKAEVTNLGANVISQLFGFSNLGNVAIGSRARLLNLRFSRLDETDADIVGMNLGARAGFDPRAAITLWQKMGKMSQASNMASEMGEFLSTHPSGHSRIAVLEQHLPEVMLLYAQAMKMPMEMLPAHQTNMAGLDGAPQDSGDENRTQPLKR